MAFARPMLTMSTRTRSMRTVGSLLLVRWSGMTAPERPAGMRARMATVVDHDDTIHDHVLDADRRTSWLFVGRRRPDRRRVEHDQVGRHSVDHQTTADEAHPAGGE